MIKELYRVLFKIPKMRFVTRGILTRTIVTNLDKSKQKTFVFPKTKYLTTILLDNENGGTSSIPVFGVIPNTYEGKQTEVHQTKNQLKYSNIPITISKQEIFVEKNSVNKSLLIYKGR